MSIGVAFRAFFAALLRSDAAERIRVALEAGAPAEPAAPATPAGPSQGTTPGTAPRRSEPSAPKRSEALTLLSTLQREARLLDLIQEPLDSFPDAQIGAAAREVLKDCRNSLDRMFAIAPLVDNEEGSAHTIQANISPNRVRLVGKSAGESGTITHRGWQATRCEIPQWHGQRDEAWILAPTEVEVN